MNGFLEEWTSHRTLSIIAPFLGDPIFFFLIADVTRNILTIEMFLLQGITKLPPAVLERACGPLAPRLAISTAPPSSLKHAPSSSMAQIVERNSCETLWDHVGYASAEA
jgi:hypothetical protein